MSPRLEPFVLAVTAAALTAGGFAWLTDADGLAKRRRMAAAYVLA
ncbi:hypothetical protein ABZ835_43150 [Streptomyces sp. NPDC047461]